MTTSSTSIDPKINEHITMMTKDPTAYRAWAQTQGIKAITPDFIPEDIQKIYANQGEAALNPWYQNELAVGKAGVTSDTDKTLTDYQRTIEDLNRGLGEDTATLSDTEGQKGTWGSSAREERSNSLNAKYGSKFNEAFSNASNAIGNTFRQGEYKYGGETPGLTSTSIAEYGAANGQATQNPFAEYRYNPFGGQGTLNVQKKAYGAQLGGDYLKARIKSPTIQ
jgi:hypothetical protein